MKNWQKNRNYKRIKDENGNVIANIITIDGIDVEVTEEVFLAYSQMDRRERYLLEENGVNKELSLEQMSQDRVQLSYVGAEMAPSAEELLLESDEARTWKKRQERLSAALESLDDVDRKLITALFLDGISAREYARKLGISDMAVRKRRDRILKQLRKFFLGDGSHLLFLREESEGVSLFCSLITAYQQYGEPSGQKSVQQRTP